MRIRSIPFIVASLSLVGFFSTSAAAACDKECGPGLVCEVVEVGCPLLTCSPSEPGVEPVCEEECEPTTAELCSPKTCTEDAECGEGNICLTRTISHCDDFVPSCSREDPECEIVPPDCVEEEYQECAPRFMGPCSVDADCGDGFTCAELESCSCMDTGSSEPECTCEGTGQLYCKAHEIECNDSEDCPAGWTCDETFRTDCRGPDCEPGPKLCQVPEFGESRAYVTVDDLALSGDDEGSRAEADDTAANGADPTDVAQAEGCSVGGGLAGSANGALALLALGASLLVRRRRDQSAK